MSTTIEKSSLDQAVFDFNTAIDVKKMSVFNNAVSNHDEDLNGENLDKIASVFEKMIDKGFAEPCPILIAKLKEKNISLDTFFLGNSLEESLILKAAKKGRASIFSNMLHETDITNTFKGQNTILHILAEQSNHKFIDKIFTTASKVSDAISIINAENDKGETPLWKACYQNSGDTVKALMKYGADYFHEIKGYDLYWAANWWYSPYTDARNYIYQAKEFAKDSIHQSISQIDSVKKEIATRREKTLKNCFKKLENNKSAEEYIETIMRVVKENRVSADLVVDDAGNTLLLAAIKWGLCRGKYNLLPILDGQGADFTKTTSTNTPMLMALDKVSIESIDYLINKKSYDVSKLETKRFKPLFEKMIKENDFESFQAIVTGLKKQGHKLDELFVGENKKSSLLLEAVIQKRKEIFDLIIKETDIDKALTDLIDNETDVENTIDIEQFSMHELINNPQHSKYLKRLINIKYSNKALPDVLQKAIAFSFIEQRNKK